MFDSATVDLYGGPAEQTRFAPNSVYNPGIKRVNVDVNMRFDKKTLMSFHFVVNFTQMSSNYGG